MGWLGKQEQGALLTLMQGKADCMAPYWEGDLCRLVCMSGGHNRNKRITEPGGLVCFVLDPE